MCERLASASVKNGQVNGDLDEPFGRISSVTVVVDADDPVVVVVEASSRDWRRFVGVSLPSSLLGPRPLSAPAVELLPPGE